MSDYDYPDDYDYHPYVEPPEFNERAARDLINAHQVEYEGLLMHSRLVEKDKRIRELEKANADLAFQHAALADTVNALKVKGFVDTRKVPVKDRAKRTK